MVFNEKNAIENKWKEYRKQAISLENNIDFQLLTFDKLNARDAAISGETSYEKEPLLNSIDDIFEHHSKDIESLLNRLTNVNNKMAEICNELQNPNALHTLERHRDILNDYIKEYKKTYNKISTQLQREKLLSSVQRNDDFGGLSSESKITNLYLKEQQHANSSEILVDEQISIAIKTRENLRNQRTTLKAIQTQMTTLANRFPIINNLMHRINIKRKKDTLILGVISGFCIFLLILYIF